MQGELEVYCDSIKALPEAADRIFAFGKEFRIWLLKGEMGTGKTTFVHALTDRLGIHDPVSSPSYALIHEYLKSETERIYHFDLFRIRTVSEIFDIGIDEYLDSGHFCLIEWPELLEPYLEGPYLSINFDNPEGEKRIFTVKKHE